MKTGIIILSHGSRDEAAENSFNRLMQRIALRLGSTDTVLSAAMQYNKPGIFARTEELQKQGVTSIVIFPWFLHCGIHLQKDIPAIINECRNRYPGIDFTLLPPLGNYIRMEDAVVEQLSPLTGNGLSKLPVTGSAIEELSHRIIDRRLDSEKLPPEKHAVYRRIIHSTADFSFIDSLRIHDNAIEAGIKALRQGAPIICDVYMVAAGITRTAKEKICCINDPQVINRAKEEGCTRAAAAVIHLADRIAGSIFVVGNAPTALWKLMEIIQNGCRAPALIVGLPVGFVGAHESKTALWKSGLCCITNESPRGGSPAAAAAVNALALLAKQNIQDVKNPVPGA